MARKAHYGMKGLIVANTDPKAKAELEIGQAVYALAKAKITPLVNVLEFSKERLREEGLWQ